MTESPTPEKRQTSKREPVAKKDQPRPRNGVVKVFQQTPPKDGVGHFKTRTTDAIEKPLDLVLPPGPVVQVFSPRMRRLVDTFLMNHAPAHVAFRAFLQGPDGGFQGDMSGAALAYLDRDNCLAALAILNNRTWYLHSTDKKVLGRLLDVVLAKLKPLRVEGQPDVVRKAVDKIKHLGNSDVTIRECSHYELAPRRIPHGPGGHHRFAQASDIPRLEEYAKKYLAERGEAPPHDWRTLIAENRILLGIVEGTAASVAQRGPSTYDRMLIDGMYTFPPYRHKGLAKNLVAALVGQAAGRGQTTSIIIANDNVPMLGLMEKLQFNKTSDYTIAIYKSEEGYEASKEEGT